MRSRRFVAIFSIVGVVFTAVVLSFIIGRNEIIALYVIAGMGLFIFAYLNTSFGLSVLILSMLLSPEFSIGGAGGIGQMSQRNVVIRIDDVVLGLITLSWMARMAVNKDLGLFIRTPLNRPMYIYLALSLISTLIGIFAGTVRPVIGLLYIVKYFQYFLIFLMAATHIQTLKQADRYLRLILFTALAVSAYAIIQIPSGVRVSAPFEGVAGEANTLGGYLVLIICIVIGLMTGTHNPRRGLLYLLLLGMLVLPFIYTLSRSSWIAIIPAMFAFLYYSPLRRYIMIGLLAVAIVLPLIAPPEIYERINDTFSHRNLLREDVVELGDTALDPSTSARILSWISTLKQYMQRPIFGWGVTGAGFKDAQYFRVLVETGVLGFAAFLYLIWAVQKLARRSLNSINPTKEPRYHGLVVGYIAGYWGLLIHAIGANTFIIVRIMEPFWFLTAIVWLLPELIRKENAKRDTEVNLDPEVISFLKSNEPSKGSDSIESEPWF
ncbi:MAG: O-antigen ligase family protein [bacterium]